MNQRKPVNWPDLTSFEATVGRLATVEDTRANRAAFLLEADGVRIGTPIDMPLPCFALYRDEETTVTKRAVVFQAEEADGIRYFGGWLIDDETQVIGYESDFDLLTEEKTKAISVRMAILIESDEKTSCGLSSIN